MSCHCRMQPRRSQALPCPCAGLTRTRRLTGLVNVPRMFGMATNSTIIPSGDGATDVRTRILESALDLLADQGVNELTQPKVARRAGVRQSHLTYYFRTRADLLMAVAMHFVSSTLGQVSVGVAEGSLNAATLGEALGEVVADGRRARVMLGLVVASDEDPRIKAFLRELVGRVRATLAEIARAIGARADTGDVTAFHAMVVGAAVLNVAQDDEAARADCRSVVRLGVARVLAGDTVTEPSSNTRGRSARRSTR